ncbi:MAG: hypothetical protein ACE5JL_15210, partial [Dehalococcoidia bacterium]
LSGKGLEEAAMRRGRDSIMVQRNETAWMLGSVAAGAFMAIAALLGILGGYLLGLGLVLVVLLSLPFMALLAGGVAIWRLATGKTRSVAPKVPREELLLEMPVVARLVEMQGSCARKIQYTEGDEFTFEESGRVTPALCGPARNGFLPYVRRLHTGEDGHEARIRCPLSGSILVFELRLKELTKVA